MCHVHYKEGECQLVHFGMPLIMHGYQRSSVAKVGLGILVGFGLCYDQWGIIVYPLLNL